jgi:hypothetical protein
MMGAIAGVVAGFHRFLDRKIGEITVLVINISVYLIDIKEDGMMRIQGVPKRLLVVSLVVLLVALASCGGGSGSSGSSGSSGGSGGGSSIFAPSPSVELLGAVTDAYSEESVEGAEVVIGKTTLTTDAAGEFQTQEWERDETLTVSAPGYEPVEMVLDDAALESSGDDAETVRVETVLRPNTLSGVVTDAYSDAPVEGAQVMVQSPDADETEDSNADEIGATAEMTGTIQATTDAEGTYTLEGVPEAFTLVIEADEYKPVEETIRQEVAYDASLMPDVLRGRVTDTYTDEPVRGVTVQLGDAEDTTDSDGEYVLEGLPELADTVEFSATGYAPHAENLPSSSVELDVALRPDVLEATLVDAETDEPVDDATIIATEGLTDTATAYVRIDNVEDGQFRLEGLPESGYIQVLAPGYRKAVLELEPGKVPAEIALEPFHAKALYVKTSTAAYMPELLDEFFDVIDSTELNAMVIDLKSDNLADLGLVYYESQVPIIQELGTSADLMDIHAILAEARKRNIYTIARIHIFAHDNLLAETMPEWAAQNAKGCTPNENRKCNGDVFYADWDIAWLDPWNRNVWDYNIQLGQEAAQMGFDEVQFDYIRFPNDAADIEHMVLSQPTDYKNNPGPMYANIATFMEQAHEAMNRVGAFFSVDVFGYAIWSPQPQIGQDAAVMAPHADYICPMVYPSHFYLHELGFDNVAEHPYEIIYASMEEGYHMVEGKRARLRPWLQDFTLIWMPDPLIVEYDEPEVRAQIEATEAFTYTVGWALWSADNEYTYAALDPE